MLLDEPARKTLLFDLDETLIHCVENCEDPSTFDHLVEVKLSPKEKTNTIIRSK